MEEKENAKIINHNEMHNCNVFLGDSYGGIFPLPGAQVTINQGLGNKKANNDVKEGRVESKEERDARKRRVISIIGKLMNFPKEMLGIDNNGKKVTNERLNVLFARCLGMSSIPPKSEYIPTMEVLWTLLIDERNQCAKVGGEEFFEQTVLNIIGYYVQSGLITGMPQKIAQCLFPHCDANTAKNVSRGITSNVFPRELEEIFDFYINKLKNGEF